MTKTKIITYLQLHLLELKYNFFLILLLFFSLFCISYYFSDQLIYLFVNQLLTKKMLNYFIFTNITEIFHTNVFIAFFMAVFLTIPLQILLMWWFVAKGLYKFENVLFIKFYFFFLIFMSVISNFIFISIIPNIWNFFLNLNLSNSYILPIYFEPKLHTYFNFIFSAFVSLFLILFIFFCIFFLIINNFFKIKLFIPLRKLFYLIIIAVSALITPPDLLNLFIILFLFLLLFEIGIYFLIYLNKYKS